jgi:hypothetical protein
VAERQIELGGFKGALRLLQVKGLVLEQRLAFAGLRRGAKLTIKVLPEFQLIEAAHGGSPSRTGLPKQ